MLMLRLPEPAGRRQTWACAMFTPSKRRAQLLHHRCGLTVEALVTHELTPASALHQGGAQRAVTQAARINR
jgi:hypothetical protein